MMPSSEPSTTAEIVNSGKLALVGHVGTEGRRAATRRGVSGRRKNAGADMYGIYSMRES